MYDTTKGFWRSFDVMEIVVLLRVQTARECPHLPKTSPLPDVSGKSEASSLDGNMVARCKMVFRVVLGMSCGSQRPKLCEEKALLELIGQAGNGCPTRVHSMIRKSSCGNWCLTLDHVGLVQIAGRNGASGAYNRG